MSEIYMDIDLVEWAENASNPADVFKYAIQQYKRGKATKAEVVAIYDALHYTFSEASWGYVGAVAQCYYDGILTLNDVKKYWSIGDSKSMSTSAMPATYATETHAAQTVTLYIVDFNHDTLMDSINEKIKSLMTLAFVLSENGNIDTLIYLNSARNTWCNEVCYYALPSQVQKIIKEVIKETGIGISSGYPGTVTYETAPEYVFIPTCYEFCGYSPSKSELGFDASFSFNGVTLGGTKYAYYSTHKVSKNMVTASFCKAVNSGGSMREYNVLYQTNKTCVATSVGATSGLMPHFCI